MVRPAVRRRGQVVVRQKQTASLSASGNGRGPIAPTRPPTKRLSILIASLVERKTMLQRLLNVLEKQLTDDVEILVEIDNRELPSGAKRNRLMARAEGEYLISIDDDDLVSEDYIPSLLAAAKQHPDVITFDLVMFFQGKPHKHTIGLHNEDKIRQGPIAPMMANHLCAWKRSLATMVRFPDWLGYGDDQAWFKPLVHSGVVHTEFHIPKELYFYHYSADVTVNQTPHANAAAKSWAHSGITAFWYGNRIVIARNSGSYRRPTGEDVLVYDHTGEEYFVSRHHLRRFTTYAIL